MSKKSPDKKAVEMTEAQAAIKHLQDRAEKAEATCEALRAFCLERSILSSFCVKLWSLR